MQQAAFVSMGANLLIHKADLTFVQTALQRELAELKQWIGGEPPEVDRSSLNI